VVIFVIQIETSHGTRYLRRGSTNSTNPEKPKSISSQKAKLVMIARYIRSLQERILKMALVIRNLKGMTNEIAYTMAVRNARITKAYILQSQELRYRGRYIMVLIAAQRKAARRNARLRAVLANAIIKNYALKMALRRAIRQNSALRSGLKYTILQNIALRKALRKATANSTSSSSTNKSKSSGSTVPTPIPSNSTTKRQLSDDEPLDFMRAPLRDWDDEYDVY